MKNLKSFILNGITCLLSVLFLIFMSQPHLTLADASQSGYKLINFDSQDGKYIALAVGLLLATIIACILILTSIYGILRAFDVIKANPADKIVRIVNLVAIVIGMLMMTLALVMNICVVADYNSKLEKLPEILAEGLNMTSGWAIGVNFTLYVFTTVAIALDKTCKKAK